MAKGFASVVVQGAMHSSHLLYALLVQLAFSLRFSTSVSGYCKPGFVANGTESGSLNETSCVCSGYLSSIVKCNLEDGKAEMANGYCMTFEFETNVTVVGKCPYNSNYSMTKQGMNALYMNLPESVFELEEYVCGGFHREGLLCSVCKESFGLPLSSHSMDCVPCDHSVVHYGWAVYVGVSIVPVTMLYIVILIFDIQLTKSPLNAYILYCQVLVNIINYNTQLYARLLVFTNKFILASIILKIGLTFYGFCNLDFFLYVFPPFCISSSLSGLNNLALQYVVALYPLVLTFCLYLCIHLYTRNFKPIVVLWKAVKVCLSFRCCCSCQRIVQRISSKGIANSFASFLMLSYSKILFVSLNLLLPIQLYHLHQGTPANSLALYYDSNLQYFGQDHLPYALLSIIVLFVFTVLPLTLIIMNPMCSHGRCRSRCNLSTSYSHSVHFFVESFQGWFKDGTEPGTRDLRIMAALYPLLRIVFALSVFLVTVLVVPSSPYSSATWFVPGLVFTCASLFFALAKPYKLQYMNTLESLQFALLGVISFLVSYRVGIYVAFVLGAIPMVTVLGYAIYKFLKCTKCLKRCTSACKRNIWSIPLSSPDENTSLITEPFSADRLENPYLYRTGSNEYLHQSTY